MSSDTIYALSSGPGRAGIAVVRVSGPQARPILISMAGGLPEPRRATLRNICHVASRDLIDCALVLWFPAPATATGEDVAEFHFHGSEAVLEAAFESFGCLEGVRPAEAGEFTRRAFLNGRLDLVEAEGVADVLRARSRAQLQLALRQMSGASSNVFETWRMQLMRCLARLEAAIDFAEEEGVAEAALQNLREELGQLSRSMEKALDRSKQAMQIQDGIRIVLAGLPNTGKSSLLNALIGFERAIVTALPGTTRDTVESLVNVDGLTATLVDTAGLRSGIIDEIEKLGIARSWAAISESDLLIWVFADDIPGSAEFELGRHPDIRVRNKCDLSESGLYRNDGSLAVSAVNGAGLDELRARIVEVLRSRLTVSDGPLVLRKRQQQALLESIRMVNESLKHNPAEIELAAEDLRKAATALGRLTGRIDVEELLGEIFSEFCIGK